MQEMEFLMISFVALDAQDSFHPSSPTDACHFSLLLTSEC